MVNLDKVRSVRESPKVAIGQKNRSWTGWDYTGSTFGSLREPWEREQLQRLQSL